ncbi:MAG TPA: ATP-binding protein [Cyclobacteriaceae bacterium]|jgi:signal transduction histidine kinase|nr:ATP-binding protein [Cyclobacteriaceae bacterium]
MKILARHTVVSAMLLLYSLAGHAQNRGWVDKTNADSLKRAVATQSADTNKVHNLFRLSTYYRWLNPDSSLNYAHQALDLAEELDFETGIFWSLTAVCGASILAGDYPRELEYAFRAFALSKKLNQPRMTGFANGMMSEYYYNLGEYEISLRYWREVMRVIKNWFPYEEYVSWGQLSRIYQAMGQPDSAMVYAKKSYDMITGDQRMNRYFHPRQIALSHWNLGEALAGKAMYDSALYHYSISISLSANNDWEVHLIDNYNGVANVFKETNKLDSVEWYARKVLSTKIARSYPVSALKATNLLSDVYQSKNNPDSALKYVSMAAAFKENLFNREKIMAIQDIHYREQEREREIAESKSRLRNQYIMFSSLVVLVAILVIVIVVLRNVRQRQFQNMRNSIADDLHDDIGSTLSSISIMAGLAKARSAEAPTLLTSIEESTISMQENMGDIVWAIRSENDRFENVLRRMNAFASGILEAKGIVLNFDDDQALSASKLSMGQRKNLYLFFKEAVANVAKHSNAKNVSIRIFQKERHVEMIIRDDGVGFDTQETFQGNGMNTLKKRASELNGFFRIQSRSNEGTCVELTFKIT